MKRWMIIGILVVAACVRLYNLAHVPPSPSLDEVTTGYNAYSILKTGADEYGTKFPLLLRAYDDFRPALYVYAVIPFVWALGLTVLAVRLPSVLLSLIVVYVTYLLGRLIGKKYMSFDYLGEISALCIAISPWHIYISRLGHEANMGLALTVVAVYFFLSGIIAKRTRSIIGSGIVFGLTVYGYQSEKIVTPLLLAAGALFFWKELWKQKGAAILAAILCVLIAVPAAAATLSPQGMVRFQGTSAFSRDAPRMMEAERHYALAKTAGNRIGEIVHGKLVTSAEIFAGNYISHFSPGWLFAGASREAFKAPGIGLLYVWEGVFLLLGLYALLRSKLPRNVKLFLLAWVLVSPVPASVTTQAPHAMRSYTMIPGLQLIEALGVWYVVRHLRTNYMRIGMAVVISTCIIYGAVGFWNGYFVRFPAEQSDAFQYAMKGAVTYALQHNHDYARIEFAHQGNLYQSYMFFLYYSTFDPSAYHALGGTRSGGYQEAHYIGKYSFGYLPQTQAEYAPDTLYFYDAHAVPSGLRTIARFDNLDGKTGIAAAVL